MNTETKQLSDIEVIGENSVSLSTEDFINSLGVDRSTGLSDSQAKALLEQNGENVLAAGKQNTWYKILFHQFKDLLNIMLSIIAIVDFAFLPFLHEDQRLDHLIQGIVILVIVICNIALATFQEVKANNALESLQKTSSPTAKVLRDGKQQIVLTKDLVIGDIVLLEEGMIVPADIRLFEANSLKIEEAALTGESLPSEKDVSVVIDSTTAIGDRANFAFASTIVTYGSGIGIVSATGMNTEIGKIAKLLSSSGNKEDLPPLKKKINKLTKTLTWFAFILLAVNAILNISFYFGNWYPSYWGITGVAGVDNQSAPWGFWIELDTIISAIALAISLIPVALPVSTTVVLSISVAKLAKKHALCKQLAIVEAIGNATVICSDKTGTLTLNKMTVTDICDYDDIISKKNKNPLEVKENFARYKHLISIGMFCNNAEINESENTSIGDPTEAALLYLGSKTDLDVSKTRNKYKRVFEQPFDSDRKLMTTVYKTKAGYTSFTKGAAESIVNLCTEIQTRDGVRLMTDEDRKVIKAYLDLLSSNALRVLGMSSRNFTDEPQKDSNYENNMIFKGLVGMIDPPRPEVFDAVKVCHEAGVKVAMITGDHQITALAIAKNLGIV
ncbi:MAG: HAD-IC family P-type ATPase, partial [Mycoplasmataceae bacterium]|nr:HAD-IC family P-type ATPase [Mycoplasmataceae bacterium]